MSQKQAEEAVELKGHSSLIEDLNFGRLATEDEYARYFAELCQVLGLVREGYLQLAEGGCEESELVAHFLRRLLASVQILRMKYGHRNTTDRPLWVDLSESGFPNFTEIDGLRSDLTTRNERLQHLLPLGRLKEQLLDHLLREMRDSPELLAQLSERTFLEQLDSERLMLTFNSGEIIPEGTGEGVRKYLFSWSCYDFASNRPYIHLLAFDQNIDRPPLTEESSDREQFLAVLRAEGSRAPNVGVLAMSIDGALEHVHPKILRRLCVGPLYSRLLLDGRPQNDDDKREIVLRNILLGPNGQEGDFMLFLEDEIVFSKRQELKQNLFAPWPRIRQIFAIPQADPDCYERGASIINRYVLLPHRLMQQISPEWQAVIPDYCRAKKWAFDQQGEIHGV